jgi:DNA-binding transcriptional regulator YiaG
VTKNTEWRSWRDERARLAEGVTAEEYAAARAEIDAEITGYQLGQLRRELGLTQSRLAQIMGVSQARVSEIERGDLAHTELDTVRAYIEALGGRLRVVADMDDRTVDIRGWATGGTKGKTTPGGRKKARNTKSGRRVAA